MKELRNPSGNRDEEDADTDDDSNGRYGNGVVTNGQNKSESRRGSSTARRKLETNRYQHIRHSNTEKSLAAKKRVIRMLFVVVVEFFVCWAPVYVMNTWAMLDEENARRLVSPTCMNFIHLLSYVSSCCNPITYCFMNKKFRHAFLAAFHCCGHRQPSTAWREASSFGQSQRTGKPSTSAVTHRLKVLSARYHRHYLLRSEHTQSLNRYSPALDLPPD